MPTTPATTKQYNAFSDLIVVSGFTSPVTKDLAPLRIPQLQIAINNLSAALIAKNVSPSNAFNVYYNTAIIHATKNAGILAVLETTYQRLISWTNRYFQTPVLVAGPPRIVAQPHILALIGMAKGIEDLLNAYGTVPNYNNLNIRFVPPIAAPRGNKFNTTWFEDLLGSVYGTLQPTYNQILVTQTPLLSSIEFNNIITAIGTTAVTAINAILLPATNAATANAISSAAISAIPPSILTAFNAAWPAQVIILTDNNTTINAQINREQWWWYPLTNDVYFSRYSRITQISTAGGIGLSINAFKKVPLMSTSINRVGSSHVTLAKDEVL